MLSQTTSKIIMKTVAGTVRCLVGALLLWAHSLVLASPTYQYISGYAGDTAYPADMNDLGTIVWAGFCDGGCRSVLTVYGDSFGVSIVPGLEPWPGYALVSDINNSGDMYGIATKGGAQVPTIWRNGVPYDLTDPANAGMVFDYDPGPKRVRNFDNHDLLALNVLDLPSRFLPTFCSACSLEIPFNFGYGTNYMKPDYVVFGSPLTNARGDFVFEYQSNIGVFPKSSYGILRVIPEPSSVCLVLIALIATLGVTGRRRLTAAAALAHQRRVRQY